MTPGKPSRTAEMVCLMRAVEQVRPVAERVVEDPYAAWFLSPLAKAHLARVRAGGSPKLLLPQLTAYVLLRHRRMDDLFLDVVDSVEQVVVLGAGYDMRAYRFAERIGQRPVFEVDFPATAARKRRLLEPHLGELPVVDVRALSVDFQSEKLEDKLVGAGFRPGRPTFWFWEGVSMYLRREAVKGTLRTLAALSSPGHLTMDFWYMVDSPSVVATAHRASASLLHFVSEPITFGIHHEEVGVFLERLGWRVADLTTVAELHRRYAATDRPVYPGLYVVGAAT